MLKPPQKFHGKFGAQCTETVHRFHRNETRRGPCPRVQNDVESPPIVEAVGEEDGERRVGEGKEGKIKEEIEMKDILQKIREK